MPPVLGSRPRAIVHLLGWTIVGVILTLLVHPLLGTPWQPAVAFALPLAWFFAFNHFRPDYLVDESGHLGYIYHLLEHKPGWPEQAKTAAAEPQDDAEANGDPESMPADKQFDKLTTLSIAPLIARAIREVFEDGSVTSMFEGHA